MATSSEERLVVLLEARISEFEKRMQQAERRGTRTYQGLRRDSRSATRQMETDMNRASASLNRTLSGITGKIGTFGKAFMGGLVAGVSIEALRRAVDTVQRLSKEIAGVGDQARRAGVSAKEFQEWAWVAQQNRIEVDTFTDGLKELQLRADEFAVTGKGSAAEAFQRLGYSAEEVGRKLKDPSALLLEIFGRMEQLDKAAQIRIGDEMFGGSAGERFVELLDQGARKIGETKTQASDLGIVMSDELIARADELNRGLMKVAQTVGVTLKSAIVSAANSMWEFIEQFQAFESRRTSTLESRLAEITAARPGIEASIGRRVLERDKQKIRERLADLDKEAAGIQAELDKRTVIDASRPDTSGWAAPTGSGEPVVSEPSGGKSSGRSSSVKSASDMIAEIMQETAALEAQAQVFEAAAASGEDYGDAALYAATKAKLLAAAQQQGIEVTPELAAQIDAVAAAYGRAGDAADDARDKVDQMNRRSEASKAALEGLFGSALKGADAFKQALIDLLAQMAQAQFVKGMMGLTGGSGGWLSSLIGSGLGFASGGYTGDGGTYQPAGVVHRGEYVFSKAATSRIGVGRLDALHRGYASGGYVDGAGSAAGSGPAGTTNIKVDVGVTVDDAGNLQAYVKNVAQREAGSAVSQAAPGIVGQSVKAVNNAMVRSKSFGQSRRIL